MTSTKSLAIECGEAQGVSMRPANTFQPALAACFITVASAFLALTMLIAKTLSTDQFGPALHPLQVTFGRFLFALLASWVFAR